MFLSGVIDGVRCSSRDLFLEPLPTSGHRVVCCSAYFDLEGGLPTENAADSDFIYLSSFFREILEQKGYSRKAADIAGCPLVEGLKDQQVSILSCHQCLFHAVHLSVQ